MESRGTLEQIEETAATWLLRRDSADWTDADQIDLDRWLAQSPSHRVAYIRLKSVWQNTDRLKSIATGLPRDTVPPRGTIAQSTYFALRRGDLDSANAEDLKTRSSGTPELPTRRPTRWTAIAATVLLTAALGILAFRTELFATGSTYITPIGGLTTIPTADGSTITLNTNTEIRVDFGAKERRIELKRGEAFFEVAHDPKRPFTVHVDDQRVTAVGTRFSVRLGQGKDPPHIRVAVTEGKVRLESAHDSLRLATSDDGKPEQEIPAGTTADITDSQINIQQAAIPEIEETLSWRSGYVVLRKTPLPEAVDEFNRYNLRQLVIEDPALNTITIGGNFRSNNLDGFIRLLEQGFEVDAETDDGQILLKRKPRR